MKPQCIIFDMDDTLVASSASWRQAEEHLLRLLGSTWSEEMSLHYKGMNSMDVAATIHRLLKTQESVEFCQKTLRRALFEAFESHLPSPMTGAIECVRRLSRFAPLALASGSPLPLVEGVVKRLGLQSEFSLLISSESVARGKPFPDVFLAAASEVNVKPQSCLVIEDSLVGVHAALAAEMVCIAIPSSQPEKISKIASRTFASLNEVDSEAILAINMATV